MAQSLHARRHIVLREVIGHFFDGDTTAVRSYDARFAGVVFPGERLTINAWDTGADVVVSATVGDDRPALSDCLITRA